MKHEIMDTLLLDRALGELSPEVAALLDAYLAQNPEDLRRAAEFNDTLLLARSAFVVPQAPSPRELDVKRLRQVRRHDRIIAWRAQILRFAACLVAGLGLGWLAHARLPLTVVAKSAPVEHSRFSSVATDAASRAAAPTTRFWSRARWTAEQRVSTKTDSETPESAHKASPIKFLKSEDKL